MNSTIEYIRRLNQSSVTLQAEWLERLRDVDAGVDSPVATPEILLSDRSSLPKFSQGEYRTPITQVTSEKSALASGKADTSQLEQASAAPIATNRPTAATQITTAGPSSNQGSGTPPQLSGKRGAAVTKDASMATPWAAALPPTQDVPSSQPVNVQSSISNSHKAAGQDLASPSKTAIRTPLENPAVLADILRPTITPVGMTSGVKALHAQNSAPSSSQSSHVDLERAPKISAPSSPEPQEPPRQTTRQVIEMMGDFGLAGDAIYTADTLSCEEVCELMSDAVCLPGSGPSAESAHHRAPTGEKRIGKFSDDQRRERFRYDHSKRQKLVDSIVDQMVERFVVGSHATIVLVAANREIDIDGAASQIATCLATRRVGQVLLVDGNLKSRQLTSVLGLIGEKGVADAFLGAEEVQNMICRTDNPALHVIGAGTGDVTGQATEKALAAEIHQRLKQDFDYTIVSGGIAGDALADSWSSMADGVYLIVDMDESDRAATISTVEHFRRIGARIVGCIATRG